jgi:hypothetical protein
VIEAPDLAVDELLVRVGGRFGIDAGEAEFLPVGNDSFAWAFKLSGDVERFLKVLGRPVDPASLEVPLFLSTNGVHMFVDDSVGSLDREGSDFFTGYGHVDPDPLLIAYYRFDWAVQEVADYGRRVLLSPDAGDATRAEAAQMFRSLFEPGDVVDAAFEAGGRVRT